MRVIISEDRKHFGYVSFSYGMVAKSVPSASSFVREGRDMWKLMQKIEKARNKAVQYWTEQAAEQQQLYDESLGHYTGGISIYQRQAREFAELADFHRKLVWTVSEVEFHTRVKV